MREWFAQMGDTSDFPARWHCGLWTPTHGWLHILADLSIWSAYTAIPIIILYYMRKRRDVHFPRIGWLFAGFIFFCGTGHLIEAGIFWWPNYRLAGAVKVCTAIASWGTVAAIVPIVPKALELPGLSELVSRLKSAMREQETAQTELARRNEELESMLHVLSHDLREPIRGIRGLISLLEEDGAARSDGEAELMERIAANGKRLDSIVQNMVQYSRVRHGDGATTTEVELDEAVQQAKARLAPVLGDRLDRIRVNGPLPVVKANLDWVTAAVYNLLSNAVRYALSEDGQTILIEPYADASAGLLGLAVQDRGPGVPEKQKERIFELFRQGVNRTEEGTGAGLAIVKGIAERYGGRAWVEDRAGGGATFVLAFGAHADS